LKLYINGNHTRVIKEIDPDRYRVIVTSGHGEETFIKMNKGKLTELRYQIDRVLEAEG